MFDWILYVIETGGYGGIFLLMVLENLFPPIPSEIIIPLSGYAAASGDMNIWLVIVVGSLGAVVGALPWYYGAQAVGLPRIRRLGERYGRWLALSPSDIDAAEAWFGRHGYKAVLLGRLVPTVRTLISVPAGLARMRLPEFLLYSFIGSFLWTALLAWLGYVLQSQQDKVAAYLNPVSTAVIILIVVIYLYRVVTFKTVRE